MNYNTYRRKRRTVKIGDLTIGGESPIAIQSMLNTDPHDRDACIRACRELDEAGCKIIRMTIPDKEAVPVIDAVKSAGVRAPLVADIHFDYRLALEAAAAGIDKIRINPGNVGGDDRVKAVADACRIRGIPIRIGVNSGSLEKHVLEKYGSPTPQALAESAMYHASLLEKFDFEDIVISVKSSDVRNMIAANRILADCCDYPLHLGVTEAGSAYTGTIKSAAGIGSLLCDGIGDTIRISLTDDPTREVRAAYALLRSLELSEGAYINVVSCPTCGRTKIPLIEMVHTFEERMDKEIKATRPLRVAIMGCIVNGPGEAREADIGLAGGTDAAVIFRKDEILCRTTPEHAIDALIEQINLLLV